MQNQLKNTSSVALSATKLTKQNKGRPLVIPDDVLEFLNIITMPAKLDFDATKAEFIRNAVLQEVRDKITRCNDKRSY
jgi:hypothetical protein